jgi:hypothetical protein
MDNQAFAALMGSVPEPGSEDDNAIVNQLRGQHDLGGLYGFSPELKDMGQSMQQGAVDSAKQIGTRRQQGLTNARNAELDKRQVGRDTVADESAALARTRQALLDDEARDQRGVTNLFNERKQGEVERQNSQTVLDRLQTRETEAEKIRDAQKGYDFSKLESGKRDGEWVYYAPRNSDNKMEEIPSLAGMEPESAIKAINPGRGYTTKAITGTNGKVKFDEVTTGDHAGEIRFRGNFYSPTEWETKSKEVYNQYVDRTANAKAVEANAVDWSKFDVARAGEMLENYDANRASYSTMNNSLDKVINAINDGGKTGPLWKYIPSVTNNTKQLESAIQELNLEMLNQYKLTPVSDKDFAVLSAAASPDLNNDEYLQWAMHKKEGIKRVQAANDVNQRWIEANRRAPTIDERAALQKQTDAIMGDFEVAFDLANPMSKSEGNEKVVDQSQGGEVTFANTMPEYLNGVVTPAEYKAMSEQERAELQP